MQEMRLPNGIKVQFPEEVVLISKTTLSELESQALLGKMWSIKDVMAKLGVNRQWVLDNILANPRYSNEIARLKQQGIIQKGDAKNSPWHFKAREFCEWLDRHETAFDFTRKGKKRI